MAGGDVPAVYMQRDTASIVHESEPARVHLRGRRRSAQEGRAGRSTKGPPAASSLRRETLSPPGNPRPRGCRSRPARVYPGEGRPTHPLGDSQVTGTSRPTSRLASGLRRLRQAPLRAHVRAGLYTIRPHTRTARPELRVVPPTTRPSARLSALRAILTRSSDPTAILARAL